MNSFSEIRVGTCGFRASHEETFADFDALEVQKTFYQPPQLSTAQRWRSEAPDSFRFTVKAWQLITHEASSPTYRRLSEDLTDAEKKRVGSFRTNEVTLRGWRTTRKIAEALDADGVLFQTPKSFEAEATNRERLRRFVSEIDSAGLDLYFEPRGESWTDEVLVPLLEELDLTHAVDPFIRDPLGTGPGYFRLHGRPAYAYSYAYTDEDLDELLEYLPEDRPAFVFFNNAAMTEDARRTIERLESGQREV